MGIGVFLFGEPSDSSLFSRIMPSSEAQATDMAIPLDEFLVNVQGETARSQSIVRLEVTVTSTDNNAADRITRDMAKVRDAVIYVVSNQTTSTIMEEKDGDFLIKGRIKERINESLETELIEDVYVTNVLIQK